MLKKKKKEEEEKKETIAKINENKTWFFEKIKKKLKNHQPDSSRRKGR